MYPALQLHLHCKSQACPLNSSQGEVRLKRALTRSWRLWWSSLIPQDRRASALCGFIWGFILCLSLFLSRTYWNLVTPCSLVNSVLYHKILPVFTEVDCWIFWKTNTRESLLNFISETGNAWHLHWEHMVRDISYFQKNPCVFWKVDLLCDWLTVI